MKNIPEVLRLNNGNQIENKSDFALRRKEILELLAREEYGILPAAPERVNGTITDVLEACAGLGSLELITISFPTPNGEFSFPLKLFLPKSDKKVPLFVLINFRGDAYDKYFPAEEIVDNGFAIAVFNYKDVASDDGDFDNGIAPCFPRRGDGTDWGKIGMWAYAASRCIDYLSTRKEINAAAIGVVGHSRLGKTALWCGANDERVKLACSNDSGCAGASLERYKYENAEHYSQIYKVFPFWFCDNFAKYAANSDSAKFDQHFLMGSIAPRYVAVGSAEEDSWACPDSERICCEEASAMWDVLGLKGYSPENPKDAHIRYHIRKGKHFLSRLDWIEYMTQLKDISDNNK